MTDSQHTAIFDLFTRQERLASVADWLKSQKWIEYNSYKVGKDLLDPKW